MAEEVWSPFLPVGEPCSQERYAWVEALKQHERDGTGFNQEYQQAPPIQDPRDWCKCGHHADQHNKHGGSCRGTPATECICNRFIPRTP